jgi:NADH-quinone oxidoreductase subunit N
MTRLDLICLLPFIIVACAPVILMLIITISRNLKVIYGISLLMFIMALLSLFLVFPFENRSIHALFTIDSFGILILGIIFLSAMLITILSYQYLSMHPGEREEYFIILFTAVLGSSILAVASHFITFFLGLELLSISLYVLIAYLRTRDYCIEAGIKFLVISSVATAFLLFGLGLIYTGTGSMIFQDIARNTENTDSISPLIFAGFGLVLAGVGFKLALVPFHMWTPDIYQGAPVPVTAFIATISKGAVLAFALRLFINTGGYKNETLTIVLSAISIISMFAGNLLALGQVNIKRLLAYSSIAHLGYLLITLITGTAIGVEAAVFYLTAYIITSVGAFGVISILSTRERDADDIEDLQGLFWTNPGIAIVLSAAFLSLAGLPLTAGFMSKFYLVLAGIRSGLWVLAFSLVINSVISLYYYLRVIKAMFTTAETGKAVSLNPVTGLVLIIVGAGILFLGIFPSLLMNLISEFSIIK